MGTIKKKGNEVIVVYEPQDLGDLLLEKAYFELPSKPVPASAVFWHDYIGNAIAKAAWRRLKKKSPQLVRPCSRTRIEAVDGTIMVTFTYEDEP